MGTQSNPTSGQKVTTDSHEPAGAAVDTPVAVGGQAGETQERRKIDRGRPIKELVKGSLDYDRHVVYRAFHRAYPYSDEEWLYIEEMFTDHLIVASDKLAVDEYYLVTYERSGDEITFSPRDEWEVVELAYQPRSMAEGKKAGPAGIGERKPEKKSFPDRGKGKRITEQVFGTVQIAEAKAGKPRRIKAKLAQADVVNENSRRYRREVLVEAVEEAQTHLHESLSQGRAILLGEDAHPSDKRQTPRLTETITVWEDIWFDEKDGWVKGDGRMIENTIGRDAIVTMEAGVLPGVSLRAYGESEMVDEGDQVIEDVLWLRLTGFDLVMDPGFQDAGILALESKQEERQAMSTNTPQVDTAETPQNGNRPLTLEQLRKQHPDLVEALLAEQDEEEAVKRTKENEAELRQVLGVEEGADLAEAAAKAAKRLAEYEAAERRRKVQEFITEALKDIPYKGSTLEAFKDYVGEPETVEEAKARIKKGRELFDKVAADQKLESRGMRQGSMNGNATARRDNGVEVIGPVIEQEANVPEYAGAAFALTESMRKQGRWRARTFQSEPAEMHPSLRFRDQYLEAYDQRWRPKLVQETKMFEDALQTTDLSLPYSVIRAAIDEAFPMLIAPAVFDTGVVTGTPVNIFYELSFTGETGYAVSVTDEEFTSDLDAWVDLDNKAIDPGSVVVTSDPAGTTFTYGTDYVIDHRNGRIMVLDAGSMADATGYLIDYDYKAVRKGEMGTIERAKSTLANTTLTLTADRLATQISDETVRFSRSQLGFDATARQLNLLVKELMKLVDSNLIHDALNLALSVASNSGGTWTAASDPLSTLFKYVGVAKVNILNRNYNPNAIIMSATNAEEVSNSDLFSAAGSRPDNSISADGFVGRMKGLPVFQSTQFTDDHILVVNREIIMYRTQGDMELMGPYPSYDATTGELIDAEQYFVREYNGYVAPIPQKASYVVVA